MALPEKPSRVTSRSIFRFTPGIGADPGHCRRGFANRDQANRAARCFTRGEIPGDPDPAVGGLDARQIDFEQVTPGHRPGPINRPWLRAGTTRVRGSLVP